MDIIDFIETYIGYIIAVIGLIGGLFTILSGFEQYQMINSEKIKIKIKENKKNLRISFIVFFIVITILGGIYSIYKACIHNIVNISEVILDHNTLNMCIGDTYQLNATVLYSNNLKNNNVIWISSDNSVVSIDNNGLVSALSNGTSTIIAQASMNNTSVSAKCVVVVKSPPSGYYIYSKPHPILNSYMYIYVEPYDKDITNIQIYAKSPSGEIFTPELDENDLYHFYSETGFWTIYASIENESGIYEANKSEDFITIEITDIS